MKHNFFFIFLFSLILILNFHSKAHAQALEEELLTVTSEGTSKAQTATEAAREIQAKAVSGTARDQIIEMIGEKRYAKNKALVENRVVREAAKFIPFVQPSDAIKLPDGSWKMKVDLRVAVGSLRKIVIDTGLLTDSETPVTILPMIGFTDRIKSIGYRWWMGDAQDESRKNLVEWSHIVQLGLHKELMRQGFHLILPMDGTTSVHQSASNLIPPVFRVDRGSSQDLKQIGDYLGISMVLRGDVRIKSANDSANEQRDKQRALQIQVRFEVQPVQGGRTVAEITRSFDTDSGPMDLVIKRKLEKEINEMAKDLATQVFEAWTRGTLAATTLRLAVRGNLSPKQLSEFRTQLSRAVRDIKAMRERVFEPGRVIYEVDYAASPEEFREKLKGLELPGFHEKLAADTLSGDQDGLTIPYTLDVKPKSL